MPGYRMTVPLGVANKRLAKLNEKWEQTLPLAVLLCSPEVKAALDKVRNVAPTTRTLEPLSLLLSSRCARYGDPPCSSLK